MNTVYLLVGESGVGKTTVANRLSELYGLSQVQSYTDRKPRYPGETGHVFVDSEFFDSHEMCAYTVFDQHQYGVTPEMLEACDLYVIDPNGVDYLKESYKGNKKFKIIFLDADAQTLIHRMQNRGDSEEAILRRLDHDESAFYDYRLHNKADYSINVSHLTVDEVCGLIHKFIEKSS